MTRQPVPFSASRNIKILGPITKYVVNSVEQRIRELVRENRQTIKFMVYSAHGSISCALELSFLIKTCGCPTEVHCLACSGVSTLIVASGNRGKRFVYEFASIFPEIPLESVTDDVDLENFLFRAFVRLDGFFFPFFYREELDTFGDGEAMFADGNSMDYAEKLHVLQRSLSHLPEKERNRRTAWEMYSKLLSIMTRLTEKEASLFSEGLRNEEDRLKRSMTGIPPLKLDADQCCAIGLFDKKINHFDPEFLYF